MGCGKACGAPQEGAKCRLAFSFRVEGDLKFISHGDTLRMFRRALVRADLPLRYSAGFNPRPRLTIPLPRPVGMASLAEVLIVEFNRTVDPDHARDGLTRQVPSEITVIGTRSLEPGERLVPVEARYHLDVGTSPPADLQDRIARLLDADVVHVSRCRPQSTQTQELDIRPFLISMHLVKDIVEFTLHIRSTGTARPAEIAGQLGYDPNTINHRICRMEVRWQ
jgi:radical SAM-linked protein